MSRLAGIHDLAYCFTRLQSGGGAAYSGDWVGLGVNLGALAGKAMSYGRNQINVLVDALKQQGTKTLPTPTAIVDIAMVAISAVDLPVVGHEISAAWQIVAAFAACVSVLVFETFTLSNSMSLSHQIYSVALRYGEVAEKAIPSGSFARIEVAGAEETKAGDFDAVSASLSAFPGVPTVASLAAFAPATGRSRAERGVLDALANGGAPPAWAAAAPAPVSMPSAPSQVARASALLARMSGQTSPTMHVAGQMMGRVQQLTSTGGQGQAEAGAGRAPVQGATGSFGPRKCDKNRYEPSQ